MNLEPEWLRTRQKQQGAEEARGRMAKDLDGTSFSLNFLNNCWGMERNDCSTPPKRVEEQTLPPLGHIFLKELLER